MEEDILNFLPTVMFRGTPCSLKNQIKLNQTKSNANTERM